MIHHVTGRIGEYLRHLGMGDLRAPDPLADEEIATDGFQFPKEYPRIVDRAKQYEALVQMPGWRALIQELNAWVDQSLVSLRECESHDARILAALTKEWQGREGHLREMEAIIDKAIRARDIMLSDLAQKYGISGVEDASAEIQVREQMKTQLQKEGFVALSEEDIERNWQEPRDRRTE